MKFFPLKVIDIRRDTRDAVVVTLRPPEAHRDTFDFRQGQYLVLRRDFDGEEHRRSYSISAGVDDGALRVGVKRVEGGMFSTWINEALRVGDTLEAMAPAGNFHLPLQPDAARKYLAFAAGSGITPILSIVKTVLKREPKSRVTLVYANRQISSIMFREELEDLKNTHLGRLSILHVLETEAQEIDLFTGRLTEEKCADLFARWIDVRAIDAAFICGPAPMMDSVAAALRAVGVEEAKIKIERFAAPRIGTRPAPPPAARAAEGCAVSLTLDGATRHFTMPRAGQSLLEAALAQHIEAPFACKAGVCSTCRAKVLEGEAEMLTNHALEDYEVRRGYVLACQCYPLGDRLAVTYDQ